MIDRQQVALLEEARRCIGEALAIADRASETLIGALIAEALDAITVRLAAELDPANG